MDDGDIAGAGDGAGDCGTEAAGAAGDENCSRHTVSLQHVTQPEIGGGQKQCGHTKPAAAGKAGMRDAGE